MKKQIIITLISMLAISHLFIACESSESTEQIIEVKHVHQDSLEEIKDNLVITSRQYKAAGIELGQLQETNISGNIRVTGKLEVPPQSRAEISTYVGGVVKSILVSPGQYVKKNQAVLTIEHPDFLKLQENYVLTKGTVALLEQDYHRKKKLMESNATSNKKFQESKSKYDLEKSRLKSIENQLSILGISIVALNKGNFYNAFTLRSPISGHITEIDCSLGTFAEPNKTLLEVTDNSKILACLDVYEQDYYKIKKGQKISITLPNHDNFQIEGKITTLGKTMDERTKAIKVYAAINNKDAKELIPGTFVNGFLFIADRTTLVAPIDAVIRLSEKQYVFIVNEELCSIPNIPGEDPHSIINSKGETVPLAFKMIEVQTGVEDNGLIEIKPSASIQSIDQLVVQGAYYLMSALKSGETVGCCAPAEA